MKIKYFVITSPVAPDRYENFKKQADHYGLKFDVFRENDYPNNSGIPNFYFNQSTNHIKALIEFLRSTSEYCVVLTDEVIISCSFEDTIKALIPSINEKWGTCWLGATINHHNFSARPSPIILEYSKTLSICNYPLGYFGYLITRECAENILLKTKEKINYFDVMLNEVCDEMKVPKLFLKEPAVYLNVWYHDKKITQLHEECDLSMYRRDFELWHLIRNPTYDIYRPNLSIGSFVDPDEYLDNFSLSFDPLDLKPLFTYQQEIVSQITKNDNINHIGKTLYFLRHIPLRLYIRDQHSVRIPIYPNMTVIYGTPEVKRNEIFIKMTKYHFLTYRTFDRIWDNVNWKGHLCDDKVVSNYFKNGNGKDVFLSTPPRQILEKTNPQLLLNLYRSIEEHLTDSQIPKDLLDSLRTEKKNISRDGETTDDSLMADLVITSDPDCSRVGKKRILLSNQFNSDFDLIVSPVKGIKDTIWVPSFFYDNINWRNLEKIRKENQGGLRDVFCSVKDSDSRIVKNLTEFFGRYQKVENEEKYQNSVFILACDHRELLSAYANGAIPIIWGNSDDLIFFNPKSYISIQDYETFDLMIEEVRRIDLNDLAPQYLSENVFSDQIQTFIDQLDTDVQLVLN